MSETTLTEGSVRCSLEPTGEDLRHLVQAVAEHAVRFTAQAGQRPIMSIDPAERDAATSDVLRAPAEEPGDLAELLTLMDRAARCAGDVSDAGFLAYTPSGGLIASALGEFYARMVNRYVSLSMAAPVLAAMEHGVTRWLASVAGLPPGSGGVLLTGGSMANFTAVTAACQTNLDVPEGTGTIYLSTQAHESITKAARLAGVPADRVRVVPTTADLRLDLDALTRQIRADRAAGLHPLLLVGTAGTTATGTVDPLADLADIAHREHLWFHVDGAYGGLFRLTERGRKATVGMELADSVTLDPHKGLFLPCGTGALVVRDMDRLRAAHVSQCDALHDVPEIDDLPDFADLSMELTREARGPRVWLPLHLYGTAAFRDALDEKLDLARVAYERLSCSPALEVPWAPDLSVVAFRLPAGGGGADDSASDIARANAANERLLTAINASGRVLVSSVLIDGVLTLRMSILSHRTHADRVREALDVIETEAERLHSPVPHSPVRRVTRVAVTEQIAPPVATVATPLRREGTTATAHRKTPRTRLFPAAETSFADFLVARWGEVCQGLGVPQARWAPVATRIPELLSPWGQRPVGQQCRYPSFVSEDGFPAELSVSWRAAGPEIRMLFESLGGGDSAASSQQAGLALTDRLGGQAGVDLSGFRRVENLFVSSAPVPGRPTVWHSMAWLPGHDPSYKIYLNPQLNGSADEVVAEAMDRLGMARAWQFVADRHGERLAAGDELDFFALDLTEGATARAKVYYRHRGISAEQLNRFAGLASGHDPVRTADALARICPGQRVLANEPLSCLAFRREHPRPVATNLYLRLPDNAPSDLAASHRIAGLLAARDFGSARYLAMLRRLCPLPLSDSSGLQELVSYRTSGRGADVGVYLRFGVYPQGAGRHGVPALSVMNS